MAKDGLFFRSVAKLHPTYKTPAVSLMVQMVWACLLCVSGSYGQLLDYIIFAVLVFYILTIVGLFVLRRTRPDARAAVSSSGLSGAAGDLYCDGFVYRCRAIALQAAVHLAGADCGAAGDPGILCVVQKFAETDEHHPKSKEKPNEWRICSRQKIFLPLMKEAVEVEGEQSLRRALGPINLLTLGIGAIIGAGIFVITGQAAAQFAGPAIVISFVLAGIACAFAGLCYAEFASMIPIAGSAYTYSYATLANWSHGSSAGI